METLLFYFFLFSFDHSKIKRKKKKRFFYFNCGKTKKKLLKKINDIQITTRVKRTLAQVIPAKTYWNAVGYGDCFGISQVNHLRLFVVI